MNEIKILLSFGHLTKPRKIWLKDRTRRKKTSPENCHTPNQKGTDDTNSMLNSALYVSGN
jgi:hypothetical protein